MAEGLGGLLDRWHALSEQDYNTERVKGTAFENLCKVYLENDPTEKEQYSDVQSFGDWARERGEKATDIGIDLVARIMGAGDTGAWCAVQCKFYKHGGTIQKKDIDSFIAASGRPEFGQRLVIDTTGRDWSRHATSSYEMQEKLGRRVGFADLQNSPIDWDVWFRTHKIELVPPKELRPHQEEAVAKIRVALAEEGSRGQVIMACGTGKTLTALRAAEALVGAGGRVLCLVPSLALMSQLVRDWHNDKKVGLRSFAVCSDTQVGKNKKGGGSEDITTLDLAWPATTNAELIAKQVRKETVHRLSVVFATYHSSPVIEKAQREHAMPAFDMAICDEAHRTAGAFANTDEESAFVRIHRDTHIACDRRLYMTATPKVYAESARTKAGAFARDLCSMEDEILYGPVIYHLGFASAIKRDLLCDYRVIVLTVSEEAVARALVRFLQNQADLKLDMAGKIIGCIRALSKVDADEFPENDRAPMQRVIAYFSRINTSKSYSEQLPKIIAQYDTMDESELSHAIVPMASQHVDGTSGAWERNNTLQWLAEPVEAECRMISNVRCLSEGVDVPSLDAIMIMEPRNSQIDIVQAVGRVMRKAPGKEWGYVILPVIIPPGAQPETVLASNKQFSTIWQTLNAIRSHDERLGAEINLYSTDSSNLKLGDRISIIPVSDWQPPATGGGEMAPSGEAYEVELPDLHEMDWLHDELPSIIRTKIVEKCGSDKFWPEWAEDVARISQTHIERITTLVKTGEAEQEIFGDFVEVLRKHLNNAVTESEAIEMLAQHLVTGPVFDALFGDEEFSQNNPVGISMQTILDVLKPATFDAEVESLSGFYESVRLRAASAQGSMEQQQHIIKELYNDFFTKAFPRLKESLGIVYTPIEVVDFILHSTDWALRENFDQSLSSEGVHILDPFTGTATFLTRLLQSGLLSPEAIRAKYASELHANEVVLLAYYIAAVNIELVYREVVGGSWHAFPGICLADTFQLNEEIGVLHGILPVNTERYNRQLRQPIQVIIGNPPWNVGQKISAEGIVLYKAMRSRITETYAARSTATLKNSLYDSYKMAIRWASDRLCNQGGVIAFVTNGSWIDGNADSGLRACLAEEFSSIYVLNLRGNAYTQGERRRQEGDNVFGGGSRAPVAITLLVRNPAAAHEGCQIYYHEIGAALKREAKLEFLRDAGSIAGIDNWQMIRPDKHHDWINQRDPNFAKLMPLGSKAAKAGRADDTIFGLYSRGYATSRDAYTYSFSKRDCAKHARGMVDDYTGALNDLENAVGTPSIDRIIKLHSDECKWDLMLKNNLLRKKRVEYSVDRIWRVHYRPFVKQYGYIDPVLANSKYQQDRIFPGKDTANRVICVPGIGSTKPFSVLITDTMPDVQLIFNSQCFPRYRYQLPSGNTLLTEERGLRRIDNIFDSTLACFQAFYRNTTITKDDIYDYVYGILHAPLYHKRFKADLSKELPRVPLAEGFDAFRKAGAALANLHLGYESCLEYPLDCIFKGRGSPDSHHFRLSRKAMRCAKNDPSILIVNETISLAGIPSIAHEYQVNGRTPLEWFMDRYKITHDTKSGIVNDPNEWFENPEDLMGAIRRIVTVSVETMQIVNNLPDPFEE